MPTYIVKLTRERRTRYFEWTTIADGPATYGLSFRDFKRYYKRQYGAQGMTQWKDRMSRVAKHGTSAMDGSTPEQLMAFNRAGDGEKRLTIDEIWERYCA